VRTASLLGLLLIEVVSALAIAALWLTRQSNRRKAGTSPTRIVYYIGGLHGLPCWYVASWLC
jgi:hypothetical protein